MSSHDNEDLKQKIFEQFRSECEQIGICAPDQIELKAEFPKGSEIPSGGVLKWIGDFGKCVVYAVFRHTKKNAVAYALFVIAVLPDHKKYSDFYGPVLVGSPAEVTEFVLDEECVDSRESSFPDGYLEFKYPSVYALTATTTTTTTSPPVIHDQQVFVPMSGVDGHKIDMLSIEPSGTIV